MKNFLLLLLVLSSKNLIGQTNVYKDSLKTRVISFSLAPIDIKRIDGISFSLFNRQDEVIQKINGLNFELLGFGWVTPFLFLDNSNAIENSKDNQTINGISIGLTLLNAKVNGISFSALLNTTCYVNGFKIGLINTNLYESQGLQLASINYSDLHKGILIGLYNHTNYLKGFQIAVFNKLEDLKGVQIGLLNKTNKLRGIQIGLWNVNEKRSLPLINWQFKN